MLVQVFAIFFHVSLILPRVYPVSSSSLAMIICKRGGIGSVISIVVVEYHKNTHRCNIIETSIILREDVQGMVDSRFTDGSSVRIVPWAP